MATSEFLGFFDLMTETRMVLTDPVDLQEETKARVVPCLTIRRNAERPITLEQDSNNIVVPNENALRLHATKVLAAKRESGYVPEPRNSKPNKSFKQDQSTWLIELLHIQQ